MLGAVWGDQCRDLRNGRRAARDRRQPAGSPCPVAVDLLLAGVCVMVGGLKSARGAWPGWRNRLTDADVGIVRALGPGPPLTQGPVGWLTIANGQAGVHPRPGGQGTRPPAVVDRSPDPVMVLAGATRNTRWPSPSARRAMATRIASRSLAPRWTPG